MAILQLLLRPLTTICMTKILENRGGLAGNSSNCGSQMSPHIPALCFSDGGLEGVFAGGRRGYDNIDNVRPQSYPTQTESHADIASA